MIYTKSLGAGEEAETRTASRGETVCFENIGPAGRRKRMLFGVQMLILGLALAVALIIIGVEHGWRLVLFIPFTTATIGFIQARRRT